MNAECYPITILPHVTRLYADYLAMTGTWPRVGEGLHGWYGSAPASGAWMNSTLPPVSDADALANALEAQSREFGAGPAAMANIEKLRQGARAVVTGQQVGLFGGPLLTLLKAATAIARAAEATARTGVEHVPIFWLATEDHDLEEVDQISFPFRDTVETLRLGVPDFGGEVGQALLGEGVAALLEQVSALLGYAPVCDLLAECYTPERTLGGAFGRYMTRVFAQQGLIVMDAAGRKFHSMGASTLRGAIVHAAELEAGLLARTAELEAEGYHAQVLVKPGASLLFLVDAETGRRQALRRVPDGDGIWKAGAGSYTTAELLEILDAAPERISPNALLRPVFQDTILPTAAYIGGPAEVAYFAQSAVIYRQILGRVTPVLPRFSATLIEPAIDAILDKDEISLKDLFEAKTIETLTQRLGARALPIEGKRKLAAAGNAMDMELTALTGYLESLDASLGRSAQTSASKMRYQMNRLRRMAATFEVQKEASLRKHATAMMLNLFPEEHPQERVLAGAWFLARCGEELAGRLVKEAGEMCLGHSVVRV